jgi:hypothetical protein
MFRKIRIALLLLVLLFVSLKVATEGAYPKKWRSPVQVALYPVNADGSDAAARFISQLRPDDFAPIEEYFEREAHEYGLQIDKPFRFTLAQSPNDMPPVIDPHPDRLQIMLWSLKLRWYTWRTPDPPGPMVSIRIFLLFHDPARSSLLPDSTGLQKGLTGIAHLFAASSQSGGNQIVIAHELLHTLGATDKYNLATNQPIYPEGFGDATLNPRYPQTQAELMAGRIAVSPTQAVQPDSLRDVIIGQATAREINWIKN